MGNLLKETKLWGVVVLLLVTSYVSAQDVPYTPFNFEGNPVWTDNAFWSGFGFEAMSTVTWKVDGSEVIDSTLYFKLFAKEVGNLPPDQPFDHVGLIRESEDRKVYFIPIDEDWYMYGICDLNVGQEYIIYDFNITVGDSIESFISPEFYTPSGWTDFIVVDSIKTIQVDLEYRNAYYLSDNGSEKWIWVDGIGGDRGIIRPTYPYLDFNFCNSPWQPIDPYTIVLTCYNDDDTYYQNQYLDIWQGHLPWGFAEEDSFIDDNCNLILASYELTVDNNRVRISPNPNEGGVSIKLPESARLPIEMSLYDIQGSQVLTLELTSILTSINLGHLTPGVYLLGGEGLKPTKIVIQ